MTRCLCALWCNDVLHRASEQTVADHAAEGRPGRSGMPLHFDAELSDNIQKLVTQHHHLAP
jgi:hypothetical protein